jgi:hypothetical protein
MPHYYVWRKDTRENKAILVTGRGGPWGCDSRIPRFLDNIFSVRLRSMVFFSVGGWAKPRTIVRLEGRNNPFISSGIEPVTFWLVVCCLNCATYYYVWIIACRDDYLKVLSAWKLKFPWTLYSRDDADIWLSYYIYIYIGVCMYIYIGVCVYVYI